MPSALPAPSQILNLPELVGWLVADGYLEAAQRGLVLTQAQQISTQSGASLHPLCAIAQCAQHLPGATALGATALTLDWLCAWLAARLGLPFVRIDPLELDFSGVAAVMSADYAARFHILPLKLSADSLLIATSEPLAREWESEIARIARRTIVLVMANPLTIAHYLKQFFSLAQSLKQATKTVSQSVTHRHNLEQLVDLGRSTLDTDDQHVIRIVDWLFAIAFEQRASDIHLEPKRENGIVRLRIDGVLHQVYQAPAAVMLAMTARIKLLGRMDVIEKRRPQDGRLKTRAPNGQEIELRLSTLPTVFGEKLVMRIFDPSVVLKTLPELGFTPDDAARWDRLTQRPHGIILVTGPTGSGKTTTLYATLKALASSAVNVCTVEDPIEMVEAAFNQMQVQPGIELSFADGVRALMRQDPDIIMVGEIRDLATAEVAIQAALTGHLVLSSLHTNDAPSAVVRLLELGVPYYLLQATLIGVVAQRLLRTLCPVCKSADGTLSDALWHTLGGSSALLRPDTVYRPVGCPACRQTGYRGRSGIYELLTVTPGFAELIREASDLPALRRQSIADGMTPLRIAGTMKVMEGLSSADEVLQVTATLQT